MTRLSFVGVIASGGERAVTIGGLGRDWLYNTSAGGILYGDTIDGIDPVTGLAVGDTRANSDNFWFAPNTTIYDAQHSDVLKFFGITLTGGDAGLSSIGLALGAVTSSIDVAGQIIGAINLGGAVLDIARGRRALGNVYYDTFLPNIAYTTQENDDGGIDLLVYNLLQPFVSLNFGAENAFTALTEGENVLQRTGVQRIKNFDLINASTTTVAGSGITSSTQSGFNAAFLGGLGDFGLMDNDNEQNELRAAA